MFNFSPLIMLSKLKDKRDSIYIEPQDVRATNNQS